VYCSQVTIDWKGHMSTHAVLEVDYFVLFFVFFYMSTQKKVER
jgi:hypothetical protein